MSFTFEHVDKLKNTNDRRKLELWECRKVEEHKTVLSWRIWMTTERKAWASREIEVIRVLNLTSSKKNDFNFCTNDFNFYTRCKYTDDLRSIEAPFLKNLLNSETFLGSSTYDHKMLAVIPFLGSSRICFLTQIWDRGERKAVHEEDHKPGIDGWLSLAFRRSI